MQPYPFIFVSPATRGLSLAITRHLLRTTDLPVFATYRSGDPHAVHAQILAPLRKTDTEANNAGSAPVDPARLHLLHLELTSDASIARAAEALAGALPRAKGVRPFIHTAFLTGGVLHPERRPEDFDAALLHETFGMNVISHMLLIKHFKRFLPSAAVVQSSGSQSGKGEKGEGGGEGGERHLTKWVHVSARVGSISDNSLGGWYSYRASKSALNQVIRTFDLYLRSHAIPAMCVGVHPGTVKTDLSREFWGSVEEGKLFEPQDAARMVVDVVRDLGEDKRGGVWDWKGDRVPP